KETAVKYPIRAGAAAVGLAAIAVGVVACGSTGQPPANANAGQNGFVAYATCLSEHGVTLPSGGPGFGGRRPGAVPSARPSGRPSRSPGAGRGGGFGFGFGFGDQPPAGVDEATWQQAQQACASVRPSFGAGGQGGNNSAFTAYRN